MTLGQKAQEYDSTSPDVNGRTLVRVIQECFRRHVTLGPCPVLNFHFLLKLDDLFDSLMVCILLWLSALIDLNL
jgi:hypothetical protein